MSPNGGIQGKRLIRTVASTTLLRGAARGIGSLVPFFVAAWFGVTRETDAFFFAYAIVMFFVGAFSSVIETLIVPFVAEIRHDDRQRVSAFLGDVMLWSGLVIAFLGGLALGILKSALHRFSAMPHAQVDLVFGLFLETMPLLLVSALTGILSGMLNAYSLFVMPAISPGFRSVVTLGFMFLFRGMLGVHAVVWGYVLGELVRLVVLWVTLMARTPLSVRVTFRFAGPVRFFFKTILLQSLGMLAVAFNPIIDRAMVASLGVGAVSVIDYADKLYAIPIIFINEGFLVVILSHWSDLYYQDRGNGVFKTAVWATCRKLFVVSLVATIGLLLLRGPLVSLVYGGRKIRPDQIAQIARVLGDYLLGFVPLMMVITVGRALVVLKKIRFTMTMGFVNTALKVLLNVAFVRWVGLEGVALSAAAVQVITLIISAEYLRRCFRLEVPVLA